MIRHLVFIILVLITASCGFKAPPLPPEERYPEKTLSVPSPSPTLRMKSGS